MMFPRPLATTACLVASWLVVCFSAGCGRELDRYPPAPFEPVAPGFPEIIPMVDWPPESEADAYAAYWGARQEVFEQSLNQTILAAAPQHEKDLFEAIEDSQYVTARTLADQLLEQEPDSLLGLYAIAHVEAFAEDDLAYALNSIRRARQQAEAMGKRNPSDPIGQEWYLRTLHTEWRILSSLARYSEVLRVVDRIEQVYAPMPWLRTFALIKLDRLDEAREAIARCQELGYANADVDNKRAMVEDKMRDRQASLRISQELQQRYPDRRVMLYNHGLAAAATVRFDEAEHALLGATKATDGSTDVTPYIPLAVLLMQQGRFPEALDALKQAQVDRGEREPYTLMEDEASTNMAIASVLLAYNESELAMRFVQRAAQSPERGASTSTDPRDLRLADGLIQWTIQKYRCRDLQEQLSYHAIPTAAGLAQVASLQLSMWATKQRFVSDLSRGHGIDLVLPHQPEAAGLEAQVQSWHRFLLLDMVPLGVLEIALSHAASRDDEPWVASYLEALSAGLQLRKQNHTQALQHANNALDALPPRAERVLRAFVTTIAGHAAWQLDQPQQALGYWNTTLRDFPQALRLLDIPIPIHVTNQGSSLEQRIAKALASSRCFFRHEQGFEVVVRPFENQQLLIEWFYPDRSRHMELIVPFADAEEDLPATIARFHQMFFQPLVELTQSDLGSLDGSPVAARMRREVDLLFGDFVQPEQVD